ncbi:MAG: leucine--tRNA ligase [Candidatus Lokiarchaeota archaeon]|nr:leucine--tRNA ligase [Candidatus Lokiarchaeota archaeon]
MYDPQQIEKKWQNRWEQVGVFEANPDLNKKKLFITSPYPYASGPLHIGNGRSFVNGDVFARYYRAQGYNVLYPMSFHITGTPVLAISSSIKRKDHVIISRMREYLSLHTNDQKEIEMIIKSFVEPWNIVNYFSKTMKDDFKSMGMSLDWRRAFTTGDIIYNKFIEWQYLHFKDRGYIEKGEYPILYCPQDKNAVGEDDISSGDELDLSINEYVCIKFPFEDGFLVASTLRPETIYGVTNIWINPDGKYIKASVNNEIWYISEEASFLLENQGKDVNILDKFSGKEFIGKRAADVYGIKEIPILPGDFVETATATGVVYSVPAHAPYDYIALIDLQKNTDLINRYNLNERQIELIYPIKIIDLKGFKDLPAKIYCDKFEVNSQKDTEKLDLATSENYKDEFYNGVLNYKCGKYQGMKVSDAARQVSYNLIEENKADKLYIPVTKNLKCRCGTEVTVSILKDQWFLNFQAGDWKKEAFKCLNKMKIVPKKYRLNFENIFNWLEKRPCARKRGLGTKLPFNKEWIIESLSDSTIYMAFYTISYKIKDYQIKPEQLTPELFDYVFLEKGDASELSNKINVSKEILNELRKEFLYWYPVDHRHTAIMHISNHLSFYIFHHVAIFPEKNWPKLISLIEPVIIEGQKMGKSKGNVISLADIQKNYGADLFRFYISHNADFSAYMDFRKKEIEAVRNHIFKFFEFFSDKVKQLRGSEAKYEKINSKYSKAMLSKITKKFIDADKALVKFNIRRYLQTSFYETFNLIQEFFRDTDNIDDFLTVFNLIYPDWLKILSLTMPHLCDELWEIAGNENFISTQAWGDFNKQYIDKNLELEFEYISNVIEDVFNIKKVVKSEKFNKIYIYTAPKWKYRVLDLISLKKDNFHQIIANLKKDKELISNKDLIPFIKTQLKERMWEKKLPQIDEIKLLKHYKSYIEKRVKTLIVINNDFDPKHRSIRAKPFKPALYINV